MLIAVPESWSPAKVKNVALNLHDVVFFFGSRIDYEQWRQVFAPGSNEAAAERRWDRLKADFRKVGIRFRTEIQFERSGTQAKHLIILPSQDYARRVVVELIGPA